jgi:hypothetical protein
LISHIYAKKKFGKIWMAKPSTIENIGDFCDSESPNLAKPRHPRFLQGAGMPAVKGDTTAQ